MKSVHTVIILSSRQKAEAYIAEMKLEGAWINQVDKYTYEVNIYE